MNPPAVARALRVADVDALVRHYEPLARQAASAIYLPGHQPDDVLQEARLGIADAAGRYRVEVGIPFAGFAAFVVKRRLASALKHARRPARMALTDASRLDAPASADVDAQLHDLVPHRGPGPLGLLLVREELTEILEHAETLTAIEQTALRRVMVAGETYADVARDLGVNRKSIDNAAQRARRRLRQRDTAPPRPRRRERTPRRPGQRSSAPRQEGRRLMGVTEALEAEITTIDQQVEALSTRRRGLSQILAAYRQLDDATVAALPRLEIPPDPGRPAPKTKPAAVSETKRRARPRSDAAPTPGESRARMSDARQAVLGVLRDAGGDWMSLGEIAGVVDRQPSTVKVHVGRLVDDGVVEAKGATRARRYRVEPRPEEPPAVPKHAELEQDTAVVDAEIRRADRAAITAAIRERGGAASHAEVREATGLGQGRATMALAAMEAADLITRRPGPDGKLGDWTLVDRQVPPEPASSNGAVTSQKLPGLKQKLLEAIARDPAALTEDRLAQALDLDREDVAFACGQLLEEEQVVLQLDGTYVSLVGEEVRAA